MGTAKRIRQKQRRAARKAEEAKRRRLQRRRTLFRAWLALTGLVFALMVLLESLA